MERAGRVTRRGEAPQAVDAVVRAREVDGRGAEEPLENLDRLLQSAHPDAGRVEGEAGLLVLAAQPARAEPELEAPAGQRVERRRLLGEDDGVAIVVVDDHRPDPEPAGDGRGGGQGGKGRELVAEEVGSEVVADDEGRVAEHLGTVG